MTVTTTPPDAGHDALVIVPIPPLATILAALEERKGSPLTQVEVIAARDGAVCMRMSPAAARQMEEARGWADIDPADGWSAWLRFRSNAQP